MRSVTTAGSATMATSVLICDDSGFARRQIARCLPDAWNIDLSFAEQGQQALDIIKEGKTDLMFLDLNMPVMDGYQTMQAIREQELPVLVIVVSGDVQPEARKRVLALGALDFIRKPVDNQKLTAILRNYGLFSGDGSNQLRSATQSTNAPKEADPLDLFREMANIAMGRAGESLANLLGEFINLPVPNVNLIEATELMMTISEIEQNDHVSALSKGFVGSGISGEALVIFSDTDTANMAKLLKYKQSGNAEKLGLEALMDVSNILTGACLTALSEQLNVPFSHYHPVILGQHQELRDLLAANNSRWERVLAIEIAYRIKSQNINFELLLLIPDDSIEKMSGRLVSESGMVSS